MIATRAQTAVTAALIVAIAGLAMAIWRRQGRLVELRQEVREIVAARGGPSTPHVSGEGAMTDETIADRERRRGALEAARLKELTELRARNLALAQNPAYAEMQRRRSRANVAEMYAWYFQQVQLPPDAERKLRERVVEWGERRRETSDVIAEATVPISETERKRMLEQVNEAALTAIAAEFGAEVAAELKRYEAARYFLFLMRNWTIDAQIAGVAVSNEEARRVFFDLADTGENAMAVLTKVRGYLNPAQLETLGKTLAVERERSAALGLILEEQAAQDAEEKRQEEAGK